MSLGQDFRELMVQASKALEPGVINDQMVDRVAQQLDQLNGVEALAGRIDPASGSINDLHAGTARLNSGGIKIDGDQTFAVFTGAQVYNKESVSDGDIVFGSNQADQANILWDKSFGQISFRGGTTVHGYINSSGEAAFGGGSIFLNQTGIHVYSSNGKPAFIALGSSETINGEQLSAGDVLFGDNSTQQANFIWDNSAGQLYFRLANKITMAFDSTGSILIPTLKDTSLDSYSPVTMKLDDSGMKNRYYGSAPHIVASYINQHTSAGESFNIKSFEAVDSPHGFMAFMLPAGETVSSASIDGISLSQLGRASVSSGITLEVWASTQNVMTKSQTINATYQLSTSCTHKVYAYILDGLLDPVWGTIADVITNTTTASTSISGAETTSLGGGSVSHYAMQFLGISDDTVNLTKINGSTLPSEVINTTAASGRMIMYISDNISYSVSTHTASWDVDGVADLAMITVYFGGSANSASGRVTWFMPSGYRNGEIYTGANVLSFPPSNINQMYRDMSFYNTAGNVGSLIRVYEDHNYSYAYNFMEITNGYTWSSNISSPFSLRLNAGASRLWVRHGGHSANNETGAALFTYGYTGQVPPTLGGGQNVLLIANGVPPSTNPVDGGFLYVSGGALCYRGTSGTVTILANA